ncbi:MAG: response regulator [Candidatus Lindowbacteria bacterium]|nr:response regulator [Candidatus Lindowbacteria bacterium]
MTDEQGGIPAQKTILYVEDNPENSKLVDKILTKAGYKTIIVDNAFEGLGILVSEKPDLLLLDMSLPGMDGWEAAQRIKADPSIKHIPIIALTAHAMRKDRERALDAGCDAYVAKPFRSKELLTLITSMIKGN